MNENEEEEQKKEKSGVGAFAREVIQFVLIALLIVVPVRVYVAQPYIVNGASMDPALEDGDYLIVDQLSYRFSEPQYGDVIVFRFPLDQAKFFIKRIIAKPKDTLTIHDNVLTIVNEKYPDGITFEEPYIVKKFPERKTYTLRETEYFVMGDNRTGSFDSRAWGLLDEQLIVGRALVRLLPVKEAGLFPGKADFSANIVETGI